MKVFRINLDFVSLFNFRLENEQLKQELKKKDEELSTAKAAVDRFANAVSRNLLKLKKIFAQIDAILYALTSNSTKRKEKQYFFVSLKKRIWRLPVLSDRGALSTDGMTHCDIFIEGGEFTFQ